MDAPEAPPAVSYRFAWRPLWILSHLFVLACIAAFISLGLWQLGRLDERRTYNAAVEANQALPVVALDALMPTGPDADGAEIDQAQYRPVAITGTYDPDQEVLIRNRTYNGLPGFWIVTPLILEDGTGVAVNRGWVPFATTNTDGPWPEYAPPSGLVTVTGMVRETQQRNSGLAGGPVDAAEGRLSTLSRVDLNRLAHQVEEPLYPVSVDLRTQAPAQDGDLPMPVPDPDLSEGSHLGYAGQWFIFAILTVIVYPLLLRRVARNRAADQQAAGEAPSDAPEHDESTVPAR